MTKEPIPFQPKKKGDHARQGDVLIIWEPGIKTSGLKPIAGERGAAVLAYGESTGHAHTVPGGLMYALDPNDVLGAIQGRSDRRQAPVGLIPDRALELSAPAVLQHEEHDPISLPAGTYRVRLQREYSPGELRNVAD